MPSLAIATALSRSVYTALYRLFPAAVLSPDPDDFALVGPEERLGRDPDQGSF